MCLRDGRQLTLKIVNKQLKISTNFCVQKKTATSQTHFGFDQPQVRNAPFQYCSLSLLIVFNWSTLYVNITECEFKIFSVAHILREINSAHFRFLKIAKSDHFRLRTLILGILKPQKIAKIHQNQNSALLKLSKLAIYEL